MTEISKTGLTQEEEELIIKSGIKPNRSVTLTVKEDLDGTITVNEHYTDLCMVRHIKYPDGRYEHCKVRNFHLEKKLRKKLYEEYGYLIAVDKKDIPLEHRTKFGSLRCFKKIFQRDSHGNKLLEEPKQRCKYKACKGSLFCKKHGGANNYSVTSGVAMSKELALYKKSFGTKLGAMLTKFVDDPEIMSHKKELATLRVIMLKYISSFSENKPVANAKKLIKIIAGICDYDMTDGEKFKLIYDVCMNEKTIIDGEVVDRIGRLVDGIGKSIERIDKVERKSEFMLTPEGLKIFLRSITDLLKKRITDDNLLRDIRNDLMMLNVRTRGEISVENTAIKEE